MSNVTDVCVLCEHYEASEVETGLRELGFRDVSEHGGGSKRLQSACWLAAFNYLDEPKLQAALRLLPWESVKHGLGSVLVMLSREDDDCGWSHWFKL